MSIHSHCFLVGFRGSGKSTVAQILGQILQVTHWDTDQIVAAESGMTIAEIFRQYDETEFRNRETKVIERLCGTSPAIISLGGGAILRNNNRTLISQSGNVVWLQADPKEIFERIRADDQSLKQRPNLTELSPFEEICQLMEEREPLYHDVADAQVRTDRKPPMQVANEIALWLRGLPHEGYVS